MILEALGFGLPRDLDIRHPLLLPTLHAFRTGTRQDPKCKIGPKIMHGTDLSVSRHFHG